MFLSFKSLSIPCNMLSNWRDLCMSPVCYAQHQERVIKPHLDQKEIEQYRKLVKSFTS
jgi:hypothetical protein